MDYSLAPSWGWVDFEDTLRIFTRYPLDTSGRLVVASDGSLTRLLETLYLSTIEVEIKGQKVGGIGKDMADYLGVEASSEAIIRDAWLVTPLSGVKGKERLVYAHSVFLLQGLNKGFLERLKRGEEPLGHLLRTHNLFTLRDNWQIAVILCGSIARDLGLLQDTRFWARRYRLFTNPSPGGGEVQGGLPIVTVAIMEVFSPKILASP